MYNNLPGQVRLAGQMLILTGKCLVTGHYHKPWSMHDQLAHLKYVTIKHKRGEGMKRKILITYN